MQQFVFGAGCSLCTVLLSWIPYCTSGVIEQVRPLKDRYDSVGIFIPPCFSAVCDGEVNNVPKVRCEAPDGPMPKLMAFMSTPKGEKFMAKIAKKAKDDAAAAQGTSTTHGSI